MTAGDVETVPADPRPKPATEPRTPPPTPPAKRRSRVGRWWWAAGIAIAALVVVILAPLASPDPDGLERVAADTGFIERATNFWGGILNGYAIPGIDDPRISTILSGLLGVTIVVAIVFVLGRVVARRKA